MNDNIKTLLELINENPELPVVCMVDSDVVAEDYGWWMASIGRSYVGKLAVFNERYYVDRVEFEDAYYDWYSEVLCERFNDSNEKIDEYLKSVSDEAFKKAIIVYIDIPDDVEEFSGEEQ